MPEASECSKAESQPQADLLEIIADLLASTPETALARLVGLLLSTTRCIEAAAFDYRRDENGRIRIGRKASAPGLAPTTAYFTLLLDDPSRHTGPSDCVSLGRQTGAHGTVHVIGLRFSDGDETLAGGYALFRAEPSIEDRRSLQGLCRLGGALLAVLRKSRTTHEADAAAQAFQAQMDEALRLGADAYWSADAASIIRHVVLLGPEPATAALRGLEGKSLHTLIGERDRRIGHTFRNARMMVRTMTGPQSLMELSGQSASDGIWHGIARLVSGHPDVPLTDHQARSLIEKLETARDRETELRRETEFLLDGLRILTSDSPSREVFVALLDLLAPALEFQDAIILHREWSGTFTPIVATNPALVTLDWQSVADALFAGTDVAATLRAPEDIVLPTPSDDVTFRSALTTKLMGGSKPTVLLCLHQKPDFFGVRHLGLGTRLSLIASQAFLTHEDRQKVVDASKLATIGEMAAGIVHEINQPLTAMTLAVSNLRDVLEVGEKVDPDKLILKLTRLQAQLDRLSKIVGGMRVLSRRSDGGVTSFRLKPAVFEALDIVQHKLTKASIEIEIAVASDLEAVGNPLEFSQVILNLIGNAHDAIESNRKGVARDGSATRKVFVRAEQVTDQGIDLTVRDTGPGFPEQNTDKAFEPFFTTKDAGKGTGLGLALCRRIVENMGGTIVLGNWSGGAEIRLRLRRAEG